MNIFSRGDHNEEYIQGDILKNETLLILAFMICSLGNTCFDSSEWTNYLGNPQRTAYSPCNGVDTPVELWTIDIPGDFGTPFIVGDTVSVLWNNTSMPMESEIFLIDVLTGEVLQESGQIGFPSGIFPVGDRIIGVYGENIYEIDPVQGKTSLLAVIPKKSHSYPVVLEDRIIFPTIPAVCLSSDFDVVWTLDTQNPDLNLLSLAADEYIAALLMSENGIPHLFVVDSSTGVIKWVSDPLPAALWVALGKDALYCGGDYVWAFDQSGLCTWEFVPRERIVSNMVLGPDALYCADGNNLYKVDTNGNLLWEAGTGWMLEDKVVEK
ncbi:MAG: hypothetical protein HXS44_01235 [Theionarchaea archaeon]|nr:hypothetical protein [Theionarchaea archaeon]